MGMVGTNAPAEYVVRTMSDFDLETTICDLRDGADGDVLSRSRVIDALLDLRLACGSRPDVIELVDRALTDAPGKNLVPTEWWKAQLDMLELAAINPAEPAEPVG
ncbi:MAG: hypothetical protein R2695_03075 [Acidimicrobiales bacterium]